MSRPLRNLAFIALALFACGATTLAEELTGVLGAFSEEIALIDQRLENKQPVTVNGLKFMKGELNGRRVVVAETGVGKVNAAMTTAIMLESFHPHEILFTGIAGGVAEDLNPGDIVIGEKVVQHDLGYLGQNGFRPEPERNPITGERNPLFFESSPELIAMAKKTAASTQFKPLGGRDPQVACGVIATGDLFVASDAKKDELRKLYEAKATEMEGASVGQVCYQMGVPFIVIRSLSDKANSTAKVDIRAFCLTAAFNSANLVSGIAGLLAEKEKAEAAKKAAPAK